MFIKFFIIIFVVFVLSRVFLRFKKKEISIYETVVWFLFWIAVIAATLLPKTTDIIARYVGVSRGADLLVYISVIVLFFIVFKLIVKIEKIGRDVTKIVRKMAIDEKDQEDEKKF